MSYVAYSQSKNKYITARSGRIGLTANVNLAYTFETAAAAELAAKGLPDTPDLKPKNLSESGYKTMLDTVWNGKPPI